MRKIIFIILVSIFVSGCATRLVDYNEINLSDGVTKKEAILIAQRCLEDSEYREDYNFLKYTVKYDKGEFPNTSLWKYGRSAWLVGFKSDKELDDCMYGAVVFEDGTEQHCQCFYGM